MFPFGHFGLVAGTIKICEIIAAKKQIHEDKYSSHSPFSETVKENKAPASVINNENPHIDYRLVLLGSLLPDIIDKSLWLLSHGNLFPSGRSYAHSFLFSLILFILGIVLLRYRKPGLIVVSICSFSHLVLDEMWSSPVVLWWPIFGPIPRTTSTGWISGMLEVPLADLYHYGSVIRSAVNALLVHPLAFVGMIKSLIEGVLSNPAYYILGTLGELLGLLVILIFIFRIIAKKGVMNFIKNGFIP